MDVKEQGYPDTALRSGSGNCRSASVCAETGMGTDMWRHDYKSLGNIRPLLQTEIYRGSVKIKVVPSPSRLSAVMLPPWASAMYFTIGSPSPTPLSELLRAGLTW